MKNINVDHKNNVVTLYLNSEIYLKKAILLASEAFSESTFINLDLDKGEYIITMTPKDEGFDLTELGLEFFNYCLGIMQNV